MTYKKYSIALPYDLFDNDNDNNNLFKVCQHNDNDVKLTKANHF